MSSGLDLNYIADLFKEARRGDSNAFAEFYAATYQREYAFALRYLKQEHLALEALRNIYLRALTDIGKINNGDLILAWLTELNIRCCFEIQAKYNLFADKLRPQAADDPESAELKIEAGMYSMRRIFSLPFSESQAIILKYLCGMSHREIAALTEISKADVKRYLKSGIARLNGVRQSSGGRA